MTRRDVIRTGLVGAAATLGGVVAGGSRGSEPPAETFEVTHTEAEWRKLLTPEQFHVLREHGTEGAGTSPLVDEHRRGTFNCAGCDLPLFSSETKFDSGTGWPSFWKPLDDAGRTRDDRSLFMTRTEGHCR